MKEEQKNKIDSLFKESLYHGGDNLDYQEQDWDAMENMLAGDSKPVAFIKKLPLIMSAIAAMLLLLLGWLFFIPPVSEQPVKARQVKTKPIIKKDTGNYGQPVQQPAELKKINQLSANEPSALSVKNKRRESKSFFTLSAAAVGRTTTGPVTNLNQPVVLKVIKDTVPPRVMTGTEPKQYAAAVTMATNADSLPVAAEKPAGNKTQQVKQLAGKGFRPTFAISVIASSDLNTIQSFSNNKLGTNAGLILTMGLSKKWSISTGAIYADKPYAGTYMINPAAYSYNAKPGSVDVNCMVLDIPLNIGYQFYDKGKNKLSVGTGLSSYLMLRESYTYNQSAASGLPPTVLNISNQNQHLFGVLNINATYQRQINSKLGVGLQPYVKLPLTNIGYGQVDLKSAGVAVSLMWNFGSPAKL